MAKVILQGFITVPKGDLDKAKAELTNHIRLTRAEAGCLTFEVNQDSEEITKFSVYEEFIDEIAFYAHQDRAKNYNWAKVTNNVERHYKVNL